MNTLLIILLVVIGIIIFLWIGYIVGRKIEDQDWKLNKLKPIVERRINTSRAVIGGQFSEQLAPFLPDFPYNPTECKFLGKPIDLIVFEGLDEKNVTEIIFMDVKSGKARLNDSEKSIMKAIKENKVKWVEYRVPEEITKKKEENV